MPFPVGKELRLKQQYFWTAASLADIMRRFKNIGKDITEFPECEHSLSLLAPRASCLTDIASIQMLRSS